MGETDSVGGTFPFSVQSVFIAIKME